MGCSGSTEGGHLKQGWGKRKLRSFREKWALVGEGGWEVVPGRENYMCKDLR